MRGLAIAFSAAFVLSLIAPRISPVVSVLVIALAALLLCSAGIWIEMATRGRDLFGWLLILMGLFDAAEVMRHVSARRAMRG